MNEVIGESSEQPTPALPLSYSTADDFGMIRPLLWLIAASSLAIAIPDSGRLVLRIIGMFFVGGRGIAVGNEASFMASIGIRIVSTLWIAYAAISAVRTRRLAALQWACGTFAVVFVSMSLILTIVYWATARSYYAAQPWLLTEGVATSLLNAVGSGVPPAAACIVLGQVRRRWAN